MTEAITPAEAQASIRLAHIEICNFRRLNRIRLDLNKESTILVGANNSGKTSILVAIRKFLGDKPGFRSFDLSLSQWKKLRTLGTEWEGLAANPTTESGDLDKWNLQLRTLLECAPTLDLWFLADDGAFNYVAPFLTSLKWSGGLVGVRLRLEPASSVDELQKIAWKYREARQPVKGLASAAHAWPIDLLDYWTRHPEVLGKVIAYKLDSTQWTTEVGASEPQELPVGAQPVALVNLTSLLRVDFVPAQRGLGAEEGEHDDSESQRVGLFSNQLLTFARKHLNVTTTGHGHRADLVDAIAKAQQELDKQIRDALDPAVKDVRILGYPGLHDPQEIHFRTRIQTADLLDHSTAVQYQLDKESGTDMLPEYSIGLGYQNLQSLSYQLVAFKSSRLNPTTGSPAAVHLVMVEEPEAHLHVQVQRVFPANALRLASPSNPEHFGLCTQLLISTHSSHLALAESFTHLRYVRRIAKHASLNMPSSEVINLASAFGDDVETRVFAERYFRVQHTDLLFADAAVLLEGTAERMLVPLFVERDFKELSKRYISYLDIGGSHAHRLKPFIERLGIPTVVITDLDPVLAQKNEKGREVRKAVPIDGQVGLQCGNETLTEWHPKVTDIALFKNPTPEQLAWKGKVGFSVRFAWQVPVVAASGQWPSSFEDALVLSNLPWFTALANEQASGAKKKLTGTLAKIVNAVVDFPDHSTLNKELHAELRENFSKGDFAATLFERMAAGENLTCPGYIHDALAWLQSEVKPGAIP